MLFIGDSLSKQLYESLRARLRQERYATGSAAGNARCWSHGRCEGAEPLLCSGHCAVRTGDLEFSSDYSSCDDGATLFMAEAFGWVTDASAFEASDTRANHCARRVRRVPSEFGLEVIPPSHLTQMLATAIRPRVAPDGKLRTPSRLVVVYNQFAHIHQFITSLRDCYMTHGGVASKEASSAATRDALRFWAYDQGQWASLLQQAQRTVNASGRRIDVYLRTSSAACDAFCRAPSGAPRTPLDPATLIHGTMSFEGEYSHQSVYWINDMARAGFRARGHGVVDTEAMMSVRVDAYPASQNGTGDKLHFCQPGVPDWALDILVRRIAQDARG